MKAVKGKKAIASFKYAIACFLVVAFASMNLAPAHANPTDVPINVGSSALPATAC